MFIYVKNMHEHALNCFIFLYFPKEIGRHLHFYDNEENLPLKLYEDTQNSELKIAYPKIPK